MILEFDTVTFTKKHPLIIEQLLEAWINPKEEMTEVMLISFC